MLGVGSRGRLLVFELAGSFQWLSGGFRASHRELSKQVNGFASARSEILIPVFIKVRSPVDITI